MLLKYTLSFTMALFCFNVNAFDISGQTLEKDAKFNLSNFSQSSIQDDLAFCNKALTISCGTGTCQKEKVIQNYIYSSCEAAVEDKLNLTKKSNTPLGDEQFFPKSYQGYDVLFSRIQDLITVNPSFNYDEYFIISKIFKEAETSYRNMDNKNIRGYFNYIGQYLEKPEHNKQSTHTEAFNWAKNIMSDRERIERKITVILNALKSEQNYMDFKYLNYNLIHNLSSLSAFTEFKGKILTNEECQIVFRTFTDNYISDLYKHTQFECARK